METESKTEVRVGQIWRESYSQRFVQIIGFADAPNGIRMAKLRTVEKVAPGQWKWTPDGRVSQSMVRRFDNTPKGFFLIQEPPSGVRRRKDG